MPNQNAENAFVQLCRLASAERWCWKMPCTTCSNHEFRFSFRELSRGRSPSDADWIIHRGTRGLPEKLGRIGYPRDTPEREKVATLEICAGADLKSIADQCVFPDWLGYLGLVLHFMRCHDNAYVKVATLWAWQLREMVGQDANIWAQLDIAATSSGRLLLFGDLEGVETALRTRYRSKA